MLVWIDPEHIIDETVSGSARRRAARSETAGVIDERDFALISNELFQYAASGTRQCYDSRSITAAQK